MDTIKITLETLYDLLRNEKKKEDLQKLEESFFINVVSYLREKKMLLEDQKESNDLFAAGEKDKLQYEIRSIQRILKELYEKREKKIIDIALNRSRTGSDIIDASAMLREEKEFYQELLKNLDCYRQGVLLRLFNAELPFAVKEGKARIDLSAKVIKKEEEKSEKQKKAKIRFLHPMPSFVWKDMKEYGPFDPGEELEIYTEVAELLVRKGRAEKI